jgi:hypothetical protein
MRRTRRFAPLLLLATVACVSPVTVEFDAEEDFSRHRTWAWLPRPQAPPADDPALHALLNDLVERGLEARGFPRATEGRPDLFVTTHVELRRELEIRTETPAMETLSSLHDSPSYTVEAPRQLLIPYERATLVVDVADGRERQLVWRGSQTRRVRGRFTDAAADVVEEILAHFPPPLAERSAE